MNDALRKWREGLPEGLNTLEAAGALLGISGSQLHRLEHGKRRVHPRKVRRFAYITGIDPAILRPDIFGPTRFDNNALTGT